MFYAFNKDTKAPCFTVNTPFEDMSNYIVVEDDRDLPICDVTLERDNVGVWVIKEVKLETQDNVETRALRRVNDLKIATDNIGLLTDVVEMSGDEDDKVKLMAWKKFRMDVYSYEPQDESAVYPKMPNREM